MANYLLYWLPSSEPVDAPVAYAFSNQFGRMRVRPGDVIWGVTVPEPDRLILKAHIPVSRVVPRADAERELGHECKANWYAMVAEGQRERDDQIDISMLALSLRFESKKRPQLKPGFTGEHLQSMRRLTANAAALLTGAWADRGHRRAGR